MMARQVWIFMTFLHMLELAAYIWWGHSTDFGLGYLEDQGT